MAMVQRLILAAWIGASTMSLGSAAAVADPVAPPGAAVTAAPAKTPTKAELGLMLSKCSAEADAKGLTVQKGKAEARKAYRRTCMLKNGVAPRQK